MIEKLSMTSFDYRMPRRVNFNIVKSASHLKNRKSQLVDHIAQFLDNIGN